MSTMETMDYKWRDRLVLFICWSVILFSAISNWAFTSSAQSFRLLPQNSTWQSVVPSIHLFLFLAILCTPILLYSLSFVIPSLSLSGMIHKLQHQRVYWLLMCLFNFVQLLLFDERLRRSLWIEFLLIIILAGMILWLFYRRSRIDTEKMILAATMAASVIMIRQTLLMLPERVDFFTASWLIKIFILFHMFVFLALLLLPTLQVFAFFSEWATRLKDGLERIPIWIFCLLFTGSAACIFYLYWSQGGSFVSELMIQGGYLLIILTTGRLLFWAGRDQKRSRTRDVDVLGNREYLILLGLLLGVYGILAVRIGINYLDNLNPDGLSYLIIARKYAEGTPVIRGYWAPLLSWLIAPMISIGADPHVGYQVLMGLAGVMWTWLSVLLAGRAEVNRAGRLAIAAAVIVIMLAYGFTQTTPDILAAVFLAMYFYWVTNPAYVRHPIRYGTLAGLSGALAYYAKYYNLLFVLIHILLTAVLYLLHKKNARAIVLGSLTSIVVLLISVTPWIIALQNRYGGITISTSGPINLAIVGPGANGHPCWESQICDQPADTIIPWEDPLPKYYPAYGWSPLQSLENLRHQIRFMKHNIWTWVLDTLFALGPLLPLSLLSMGIAVLSLWSDNTQRLRYSWIILTVLLYISAYMFTFFSFFRYYYSLFPLIIIAGFSLIQKIFMRVASRFTNERMTIKYLFMGSVLILAILSIGHIDLIMYFLANTHEPCLRTDSEAIGSYLEAPIVGTDWKINHVAYYTSTRTLGVLRSDTKAGSADNLLREYGVRTFLVSRNSNLASELPKKFRVFDSNADPDLWDGVHSAQGAERMSRFGFYYLAYPVVRSICYLYQLGYMLVIAIPSLVATLLKFYY